jgi:hypothetical protein
MMPCSRGTATGQLKRMSSLQGFGFMAPEAFTDLIDVLCSHADDASHAKAAVDLILGRKALPTGPQDIADALNEAKHGQPVNEAPRANTGGCGRVIEGLRYWDYDPNSRGLEMILHPARCDGGQIRITKWVRVQGMVDENGNQLKQPYHFSGKCRCAGGTL